MTIQNMIDALTTAIPAAREAGLAASANGDDAGTCNFDAPVLILPGMSEVALNKILAPLGCSCWRWKGAGPGAFILSGFTTGQGNARTRGAEAAQKVLEAHGLDTTMYYQMD